MKCDIVWLSHGGPGSGRYPKGSGKKYFENRSIITKNKEKIYSLRKKPKNKNIYYYKIIKDGKKIAVQVQMHYIFMKKWVLKEIKKYQMMMYGAV